MVNKAKSDHKPQRNAYCQCLMTILIFIRRLYDSAIDLIFSFIYSSTEVKKLPPPSNDLVKESAVSLAKKIRNKEITSEAVVGAFIQRIKEVNDIVNAVVQDRFERALEEAKAVDRLIASGSVSPDDFNKKPLLGVPFTSKESVAAEGMPWSCGILSRKGTKAVEDADIVKSLKSAGAILIAVTNIPELNMWIECRNYVYGQTNNPYNTNRIVGGSSGGEACIVSCCGSPIGLGTDIGGSARLPAYFCGVYGHKLSGGLVNTKGMSFRDGTEKDTIVAAGGLLKHAADLKVVNLALVLPEKIPLLRLNEEINAKKFNYFFVEQPGDRLSSAIGSECNNALLRVVRLIKEHSGFDNSPQKVHFPGFKYSFRLWKYWMSKELNNFAKDLANQEEPRSAFIELPKKLVGKSDHTLAAILKLVDQHLPLPKASWAEEETATLRNDIIKKLGDNGVLLFPSYASTAPYHYVPFFRPFNFSTWAIFNVLKFPVTQIPIGLSKEGLPLGIQIVAAPYQDKLCFAAAEYIESLTGGWVPPFTS